MNTTAQVPANDNFWFDSTMVMQWDEVEYHPCKTVNDGENGQYTEQCEPDEAEFWSVYLHDIQGGILCVADVENETQAKNLASLIERAAQFYTPSDQNTRPTDIATTTAAHLPRQYNSIEDVQQFARYIAEVIGAGFHPDTDMKDYKKADGKPLFSRQEAKKLQIHLEVCFGICHTHQRSIFDVMGAITQPDSLFGTFEFSEFRQEEDNGAADIIKKETGKIVDTYYIPLDGRLHHTETGRDLAVYGLKY
jgi:hypothetical protein